MKCQKCNGEGTYERFGPPEYMENCDICHGTGQICPPDCAGVTKIELDTFAKMMEIALCTFVDCNVCPDSDKDCHFWTSDNRPTTCKYYLAVLEMQKRCL